MLKIACIDFMGYSAAAAMGMDADVEARAYNFHRKHCQQLIADTNPNIPHLKSLVGLYTNVVPWSLKMWCVSCCPNLSPPAHMAHNS